MGNLKNLLLLQTPDSAQFTGQVYACLQRIVKGAYDNKGLAYDDRRSAKYFLDNGDRLARADIHAFENLELKPRCADSVRRQDVYLIPAFTGYTGDYEPNVGYMKLFLIHDALWRSDARDIVDVMPHIPYLRQDRKDEPRVPISAKAMAGLTERSANGRLSRLLTIDLHVQQAQGFYNVPVDALDASPVFAHYVRRLNFNRDELSIVAPDAGAVPRAEKFLEQLDMPPSSLVVISKRRSQGGKPEIRGVIGDVKRTAIILDDILGTGGTIVKGAEALRKKGAEDVYVFATHAIMSPKDGTSAEEKLRDAGVKAVVTDTIPRPASYYDEHSDWLTSIDLAPFLGDAIFRTQLGRSTKPLFDRRYVSELYQRLEEAQPVGA